MIISLGFTIQSHSYHQSRFFNSSSWVAGNIYETSFGITSYFDLATENKKLVEENKKLQILRLNENGSTVSKLDSTQMA
jgi:rod shape-determining protein MreC